MPSKHPSEILIQNKTLEELLGLHALWLQTSKGKPLHLSNLDLSYVDLTDRDLSKAALENVSLDAANLSYTKLNSSIITDTTFKYAKLYKTNLSNAQISNSDFKNALLDQTNLRHATIQKSNFSNTVFKYTDLSFTSLPLSTFLINNKKIKVSETGDNFRAITGTRHTGYRLNDIVTINNLSHTTDTWLNNLSALLPDYSPSELEEYRELILASK